MLKFLFQEITNTKIFPNTFPTNFLKTPHIRITKKTILFFVINQTHMVQTVKDITDIHKA